MAATILKTILGAALALNSALIPVLAAPSSSADTASASVLQPVPQPDVIAATTANEGAVSLELLAVHNRYRRAVGVPPLRWSEKLAAGARDWALKLAREGRFEHSPHGRADTLYGENLALGTGGPSATWLVDLWGEEQADYIPGARFPDVAKNGDWATVGHYTQMIWRDTQEVGCGLVRGPVTAVLVCRYFPTGNWIGQLPY